ATEILVSSLGAGAPSNSMGGYTMTPFDGTPINPSSVDSNGNVLSIQAPSKVFGSPAPFITFSGQQSFFWGILDPSQPTSLYQTTAGSGSWTTWNAPPSQGVATNTYSGAVYSTID